MENEMHLWSLHLVFLPRLCADLSTWRRAWNQHPIRTEHNKTPQQLWHNSFIIHRNSHYSSIRNVVDSTEESRQEQIRAFRETGPFPEPSNIKIPFSSILSPLTEEEMAELHRTIDVGRSSDHHGIDIYEEVIMFIRGAHRNRISGIS